MANANPIDLAEEEEKKLLAELERQRQEEAALMGNYSTKSKNIYDTAKNASRDLLIRARNDIESLYNKGYADLQSLIDQESAANMKELVRQQENKLASQGLLGGPSGALNEALADAARRVRTQEIARLADYINNKTGALSNLYSNIANQLLNLEQVYGQQLQGLSSQELENALKNTAAKTSAIDRYTMAGLEAALGTNKINVETEASKDLAKQQADLNAALLAAQEKAKAADLKRRQDEWERNYQFALANLYRSYIQAGWMSNVAEQMARQEALRQVGPKPLQ